MAADLDTPTLDSTYVNVVQDIRDSDNAVALMFNGVSATNIPVGAIQFAGGVFGTWNGSSFDVTPVVIGGGGTGATTAEGARTNLSLSSVAEANALYMKILSNGSDINNNFTFRQNLEVYSKSELDTGTLERLRSDSNLTDVASTKTARESLGIYTISVISGATGGSVGEPVGWLTSRLGVGHYEIDFDNVIEPSLYLSVIDSGGTLIRTWTAKYGTNIEIFFRDGNGDLADTTFRATFIDRL